MAFAVGHVGDQAFRFAKLLADDLYDIDVLHLVVSADVVDFADTTLVDDQVNGTAVIFDVQPVTYIFTLTIYRKRFVIQRICDHQRDQLLREMIRTVVVGAAADGDRKTVGAVISENKQIGRRLG